MDSGVGGLASGMRFGRDDHDHDHLVDLDFEVVLPDGRSGAELAARLRQASVQLGQMLTHEVVDVQPLRDAGDDGYHQGNFARVANAGRGDDLEERFNHPTVPIGPRCAMGGSYWEQRQGSRIRELAYEGERKAREQGNQPVPFRARAVPASVSAPRFQAMVAADPHLAGHVGEGGGARRRGRSAEARPASAGPSRGARARSGGSEEEEDDARSRSAERPAPFRARPVPWKVSAPLYEQMLVEEAELRRERVSVRSRELMRGSSLPPRLERVRARLCGDAEGGGRAQRASTPKPACRLSRGTPPRTALVNRPLRSELPRNLKAGNAWASPGEILGRSIAGAGVGPCGAAGMPAKAALGTPPGGTPHIHGAAYGLHHFASQPEGPGPGPKRGEPDLGAFGQPFGTTDVPNFKLLHERELQRMERRKWLNRHVTKPEPFIFHAPTRSQSRQAPMPKDPSKDPRWKPRQRPQSAGAAASRDPGHAPPQPKSTLKTSAAQQHVFWTVQERREQERREKEGLKLAQSRGDSVLQGRVRRALGEVENFEDKIKRAVNDKRQNHARVQREKQQTLQMIKDRVNRRPLLMEQSDSIARARRRALGNVRRTLEAAKLDPDEYFRDDELDELDGYA